MAEVDMVCDDDTRAAKLGAEIARVLQLRPYTPSKPMWETTQGLKTDAGLARTVLGLMQAEAEQMESKYYDVFHRTWWKENPSGRWPKWTGAAEGGAAIHRTSRDLRRCAEVVRRI